LQSLTKKVDQFHYYH